MTFVQDDNPDKGDRLLMYSMLGVVVMTVLAFAIAHFNKPPVAQAFSPIVQQAPGRDPGPVTVEQMPRTFENPYYPPLTSGPSASEPATLQPPAPSPKPRYTQGAQRNAKLNIWRDITAEH